MSTVVLHRTSIPSITLIHEVVFKILGKITGAWIDWLFWGLTKHQSLRVILCCFPEKGRKEIVEEMKDRDREERGKGKKVKEQKKLQHSLSILTCCKDSRPCPTVSHYQLGTPVTKATGHLSLTQPPPLEHENKVTMTLTLLHKMLMW